MNDCFAKNEGAKIYCMSNKELRRERIEMFCCGIFIIIFGQFGDKFFYDWISQLILVFGIGLIIFSFIFRRTTIYIDQSQIIVYKNNKLKAYFDIDDIKITVKFVQNNERLVLTSSNKNIEITRFMLGQRVYNEFKQDMYYMIDRLKVNDFTTSKEKRQWQNRPQVEDSEKLSTVLGRGVIWFIKAVIVVYIEIMFVVAGIIFITLDKFYLGALGCLVGFIAFNTFIIIRLRKNKIKKVRAYLEENIDVGFVHIESKGFASKKTIKFQELQGPTTVDTLIETNVKPKTTYFLKEGSYIAVVSLVDELTMPDGSSTITTKEAQLMKFEIEAKKFYVLSYNKVLEEYNFREEQVPRSLNDILQFIELKSM